VVGKSDTTGWIERSSASSRCAGVVAAACTQGKRTQHGKPLGVVGDDQPDAGDGQAGRLGVAERLVVCAGQRVVQEGSSPSDARMRGVISERGGNASRAGERKEGMERPKRARRRKPDTAKADLQPPYSQFPGGQGVHREVGSEGHEEKYRVVVEGAIR
jgi:hypothetical protein